MMVKIFKQYITTVDWLIERLGTAVSWLTSILVLLIGYDVVMRYFFNRSSAGIYELEWHLFSMIFLLGAAYALKHDRHVRVDVIYHRLSEKKKAWINLIGTLVFLIPLSLVIIKSGFDFAANAFALEEISADPGGLPARFLIKSVIPVGFAMVFLQALSLVFKSIITLTKNSVTSIEPA